MKHLSLIVLVFLIGCSPSSKDAEAAADVYARYVCVIPAVNASATEFKSPWVEKGDVFTGDNCSNGATICWWAKTHYRINQNTNHKFMYIPVPGSTCHYEEAEGQKPNDWD
jgi:hypothetical protein